MLRARRHRLVPLAPSPSNPAVTAAMRGNRRTDTTPELRIRRLLHSLGYRYRLHVAVLPGKPDIVFPRRRCVIQVHGCFWHQHADPKCPLKSRPKSNVTYWNAKLNRNVFRDREHEQQLRMLGWRILIVWECECQNTERLRIRLQRFLESRAGIERERD